MKKLFLLLFLILSNSVFAQEQAEQIFSQLAPSVYQIKIIDKASGEKSSIGTGFQISADGLLATNYHVISSFARHPSKYAMEFLDNQGNTGSLTLESVDVINDLAIVKREVNGDMPFFTLSDTVPKQGEKLFSLGNPHDLGMIVVPGTYNGLKKESFNDRIHFTGSINPGMSGGPVVNAREQVVGINVATAGNDIGFLIPHSKLVALFEDYLASPPQDIDAQMAEQLAENQEKLISSLINAEWNLRQLQDSVIPIIDVPFLPCWGDSNADKEDALILTIVANCSLEEDTYISSHFFTASIDMEFRYIQGKGLSSTKFYHLYEQQIGRAGPGNAATKDDVSEYQCHHDVVAPDNGTIASKTVFCTRAYKDFEGLFDVLFLSASVDKETQALISHFTISGVEQDTAMAFTKKFMEAVSWK